MVRPHMGRPGGEGRRRARLGVTVGVTGPVFPEVEYEITRELVGKGETRGTEFNWIRTALREKGSGKLKDEVMKVQPVQKQTRAGQRTRFKAFVLVGDFDGHVGLGVKVGKEVANAIRAAIIDGKMNVVPVRRGYWGNKIGLPHTVPNKIHGKCGSVHIRLVPAPRGTTGTPSSWQIRRISETSCVVRGKTASNGGQR